MQVARDERSDQPCMQADCRGSRARSTAPAPAVGRSDRSKPAVVPTGWGSVQLALQCAVTLRRVSERRADAGTGGRVAAARTLPGDGQASLRYRVLTGVPE